MEICCTEHVRNEDILPEKRRAEVFYVTKRRKANWIGHILLSNCLLTHVMEGKIKEMWKGTERRGRRHQELLDDRKERRRYWNLKDCDCRGNSLWKRV
jgi:hypothetical protein